MATPLLIPEEDSLRPNDALLHSPRVLESIGGRIIFHADSHDTAGAFSLLEIDAAPGVEPPLHVHSREDELFFVLEGELVVNCGFSSLTLGPGQSGFLPRQLPHTFRIASDRARWLVYITPGGFEEYFRALAGGPASYERMAELAGRHGIKFLK